LSFVERELYRKLVHLALSFLLLYPFFFPLPSFLNVYIYYSLGLLAAALLNSIVVKRFKLESELEDFSRELHRFIDSFGERVRTPFTVLEEAIDEFHSFIEKQLSLLERDYEKREGYVGLLYGMIGAVASLLIDPCHTFYGVVALAAVDAVASISSLLLWRKGKTLGGEVIALLVYLSLLLLCGGGAMQAVATSVIVTVTEFISPEDNLTVPVVATVITAALGLPPRCPV